MTAEEKVQQLSMYEQSLSQLNMQKQQFQIQVSEIESALNEIKSRESAYKIVGNIMIKKSKNELENELVQKKEMINIRIDSLEKQEAKIKEKTQKLQKEVQELLKK